MVENPQLPAAADLHGKPTPRRGSVYVAVMGVAVIRFEELPEVGHGELRLLVTAKVLGC